MDIFKRYKHNPPHLFRPKTKYFITGSIYGKLNLLSSGECKTKLLEYVFRSADNFEWVLEDWVILNNHYHLMLESPEDPTTLGEMMGNIHRYSAIWINKNVDFKKEFDKIWHNYWDKCLTFESSYYTRLNYIWFNPVKHRLVDDPISWEFGSYFHRYNDEKEYLQRINKMYPHKNIKIDDNF